MKKNVSRKVISTLVLIAFFSVFCFPAYPAQGNTNQTVKTEKQEKEGKVKSEAETEINEYYSRDDANVIEDEGYPGGPKKKKFPWLLVVGGVVVVGVVLYFVLAKKPKYDLDVSVGAGVNGAPAAGSYSHKKGTVVSYSYSLQSGYTDLKVKVDGQSVPASGSITMDKNHTLTATATEVAYINVKSTPTGAQILMDGSDTGYTTNHNFSFTSGGSHAFILRKLGYKEYSTTVNAVLGQTKTINKTLEKGLHEDFDSGATSSILWKWEPHSSGNWTVTSGKYVTSAKFDLNDWWNYSIYNHPFSETKYTVIVKIRRTAGNKWGSNIIEISSSNNLGSISGYGFVYDTEGWVAAWKDRNYDYERDKGQWAMFLSWRKNAAVNKGLGSWNIIKIVRDGSNYSYYINNTLITSFNDSMYSPKYILLLTGIGGVQTQMEYDYVYLDVGNTAGSVRGPVIKETPIRTGKKSNSPARK